MLSPDQHEYDDTERPDVCGATAGRRRREEAVKCVRVREDEDRRR